MTGRTLTLSIATAVASLAALAVAAYTGAFGLLLIGFLPVLVPAAWCAVTLVQRDARPTVPAIGGMTLAAAVLLSPDLALHLLGWTLSGVAAGWALGRRRRWDLVLAVAAAPLLVLLMRDAAQVRPADHLDQLLREGIAEMRANPPGGLDEADLEARLVEVNRIREEMIRYLRRFWTGGAVLGQIGLAGLAVLLGLAGARRWAGRPDLPRVVPLSHWRVPYYLVWVLAAGLAGLVLRNEAWRPAAENTVLVACGLFLVQGLAVQVFVMGRILSGWLQVVFWVLAGLFAHLLLLLSGVVLGVLDQWLDLRRMIVAAEESRRDKQ